MAFLNPYIHFNGNAMEAFTFYQSIFGGEFSKVMRYREISSDQYPIADDDAERLMYIALPIGANNFLLGSDVLNVMGQVNEKDNRNSISIHAESREEADRLFAGLAAEGAVEMPMADGPFGAYFGMTTDKFGIQWMINFEAK